MENKATKICSQCGAPIDAMATACRYCGADVAVPVPVQYPAPRNTPQPPPAPGQYAPQPPYMQQQPPQQQYAQRPLPPYMQQQAPPPYARPQPVYTPNSKSKVAAGLLAILLGGLGVHKFYLGRPGQGILYLLFCWTGIPSFIALIEGIVYLASSDEAFYNRYVR